MSTRETRAERIARLTAALTRLDNELENRKRQRTAATIVFIVGLFLAPFVIGIPFVIFALLNYFRHKSAIQKLNERRIDLTSKLAGLKAG